MHEDWDNIRQTEDYKEVKYIYQKTITDGSDFISLDKMYMETPWVKEVTLNVNFPGIESYKTLLYDKYIRLNNSNICMPHTIKIDEPCTETDEKNLSESCQKKNRWYNILTNEKNKPKSIGEKKIPSYLKIDERFNSLSRLKYAIERCLNNTDYADRKLIKGILIPLNVTILESSKRSKYACRPNHACMIFIKIYKKKKDNETKIKLDLLYFDPNSKPVDYLQTRFNCYKEAINSIKGINYEIVNVRVLNLELNFNLGFMDNNVYTNKAAIHDLFPSYINKSKWVDNGICASVSWFIFILWSLVCPVVNTFEDLYSDISIILYLKKYYDFIYSDATYWMNEKDFKERKNIILEQTYYHKLDKKYQEEIDKIYVDFIYLVYYFLKESSHKNLFKDQEYKELYKLRYKMYYYNQMAFNKEKNKKYGKLIGKKYKGNIIYNIHDMKYNIMIEYIDPNVVIDTEHEEFLYSLPDDKREYLKKRNIFLTILGLDKIVNIMKSKKEIDIDEENKILRNKYNLLFNKLANKNIKSNNLIKDRIKKLKKLQFDTSKYIKKIFEDPKNDIEEIELFLRS